MYIGEGMCIICGKPLFSTDISTTNVCTCQVVQTGWICPVCGRGNSPYTITCPCVPYPNSYPNPYVPPVIYGQNEGTGGKING